MQFVFPNQENPQKILQQAPVFCFWKETKWILKKDGHLSRTILICKTDNCVIEWLQLWSKIYTVRNSGNSQVTLNPESNYWDWGSFFTYGFFFFKKKTQQTTKQLKSETKISTFLL